MILSQQKTNATFLKLWSYITNSSVFVPGTVNHLHHGNSSGCVCRHAAEEGVPKSAICCDLSTKSLGVRDAEISLSVLISLPPESHLKVHRFLPLLWYKCLWCSHCVIGNVLVYYIFINILENHLLKLFFIISVQNKTM